MDGELVRRQSQGEGTGGEAYGKSRTEACSLATRARLTDGQWGTQSELFRGSQQREIQGPEGHGSSRGCFQ